MAANRHRRGREGHRDDGRIEAAGQPKPAAPIGSRALACLLLQEEIRVNPLKFRGSSSEKQEIAGQSRRIGSDFGHRRGQRQAHQTLDQGIYVPDLFVSSLRSEASFQESIRGRAAAQTKRRVV
jgi:hypothetical protein